MAQIYRVIQIKLNRLVSGSIHVIADSPAKRIITVANISQSFYLQDGGNNQVA